MFYSLELGLNIVGIHINPEDYGHFLKDHQARFIKERFKGMKLYPLPDGSYLAISIWCPNCDRIQNKDVYVPKWKHINKEPNYGS